MDDDGISLHLTAERIETFCGRLAAQLHDHQRRLAALHSLQTFIATTADAGEQSRPGYNAILDVIERHAEQARAALLAQNGAGLRQALQARDAAAVARLYRSLSRSGFWETLAAAIGAMTPTALSQLADWATQWQNDARRRGEQASGFPDAIDFHKAGIDVAEYTAIEDLNRYLAGVHQR